MGKYIFTATNPCHIYHLARACAQRVPVLYMSGYPQWRLNAVPSRMEVVSFSWRTLLTYFLVLKVPGTIRPDDARLYRWQDKHFDHSVAKHLARYSLGKKWSGSAKQTINKQDEEPVYIHAMPGQCVETFKVAKSLGIRAVLNHPTGPVGMQLDALREEYERVGLTSPDHSEHARYLLSLEQEEYSLADYHCVASSVVKEQLCRNGIVEEKIWVVPYGADPEIWNRGAQDSLFSTEGSCQREDSQTKKQTGFDGLDQHRTPSAQRTFRIVFAGQLSLRKGLRFLLEALEHAGAQNWTLNVYGRVVDESKADRNAYSGAIPVNYHGAVGQAELAEAFQASDLLVLPSLEEGFGLVVPQALSCGIPCVVSDRVGAKDLIREGVNGSVFTCGDSKDLEDKIVWWANNRKRLSEPVDWEKPSEMLMQYCKNI